MRKLAVLFLALGLVACSDDTGADKKDLGKRKDGLTRKDNGGTNPDAPPGKLDKTGGGGEAPLTTKCGAPFAAKTNSAKSCTTAATACGPDEICVSGFKNAAGTAVKICLGKCCANLAKIEDPVNKCPTGTVTNALSLCLGEIVGKTDMMCMPWICEATVQGQTVKYDCPDANYDCVADPQEPDIKLCIPKA